MGQQVVCEHCGKPLASEDALVEIVESWPRYFCCEECKIVWGEQAEIENEQEE